MTTVRKYQSQMPRPSWFDFTTAILGLRFSSYALSIFADPSQNFTYHFKQEAFGKCWAHSPLRTAARRIAIH